MKKLVLAVAAAMTVAAPMAAFAAPPQTHTPQTHTAQTHTAKAHASDTMKVGHNEFTSGVVAAYAPDTRMLKLSAGEEFKLAPAVTNASYKTGDKVTVRWQMKDGARIADEIKVK